ncbi:MAG TPA: calcium-binding protein [Allosphingosinicella sp.]|nr:calcium-binding protein [Allosphingosinicella sp.]
MATPISGDNEDNVINSGYVSDMIFGLGGMDTLNGGWGDDTLFGGTQNDTLNGGQNDDFLSGDEGDDTLDGGTGSDFLSGGIGKDKIDGGAGDDFVTVSSPAEFVGDVVDGGSGVDTLILTFNTLTTAITFIGKDPILTSSYGTASFTGIEQYQIFGGSADDKLTGYLLADFFMGGKGNDTLKGLEGADILFGDEGNDFAYGGNDGDTIDGGIGNDTVSGDAGADFVSGGAGADKVNGGTGGDNLCSGAFSLDGKGDIGVEVDTIVAGTGDDRVEIGIKDVADGGNQVDTIQLDFTASKLGENFTFSAAAISFANGGSIVNFEKLHFFGGTGRDFVTGGVSDDALHGGGSSDSLAGGDGNDLLYDDAGNDLVHGNGGNDSFFDGRGADRIFGDAGDDTIMLGDSNADRDVIDGGADKDIVLFWRSEDDAGEGEGSDLSGFLDLTDQSLNDGLLLGDTFKNVETFIGSDKDDFMFGNAAGNNFHGSDGDDLLDGRAGNDLLHGGEGSDTMTGGDGKDVFDLSDQMLHGAWFGDIVTDFTRGQDKLQISLEFLGIGGPAEFSLVVGNGPAPTGSGPQLLFDTATHRLFFDEDGAGTEHEGLLIATLEDVTTLSVSDFQFI